MPSLSYPGSPPWHRLSLLLLLALALLTPTLSQAVDLDWTRDGQEAVYGELTYFDFSRKTVTIKIADSDTEIKFPSSELDSRSRWMALFSTNFLQSIPNDNFQSEHWHLAIIFIAIPAVLYLFSFWISAMLVTRKINPLRAIIALPGAWLLSGFLIVFYIFMIGRSPDKTLLICVLGGLVTLTVASLFVSIIYHKTIIHGLVIIIFHSILAPLIFASTIYATYKFGDTEKVDAFFNDHVFTATGLLPEKENEA